MDFAAKYGPWAVITGASEGTGSSFAHQVAAQGVNCILIARREGPLDKLAAEISAEYGVQCITASIDLSANDATARLAAVAGDREVGLLICNAGADDNGSLFLNNDIAKWDALVMRSCYHFAKPMQARKRGGIIIVGSGACYGGLNGIAIYSATKAFDLCFGEALWAELRHDNVDVLNLIMGRTDTPAHKELMERQGIPWDPSTMATADEVAQLGLARLPFGPVQNWGLSDDEVGYAITSAAQRRARILAIEEMSKKYAGKK